MNGPLTSEKIKQQIQTSSILTHTHTYRPSRNFVSFRARERNIFHKCDLLLHLARNADRKGLDSETFPSPSHRFNGYPTPLWFWCCFNKRPLNIKLSTLFVRGFKSAAICVKIFPGGRVNFAIKWKSMMWSYSF